MTKNKSTLYEIGAEMAELFQYAEMIETEEEEAEFKEKFKKLDVQLGDKMLACRHMIRQWEGQSGMLREEEKRLAEQRHRYERSISYLMSRVRGVMEMGGLTEFISSKIGLGFKLVGKGGNPPVEILDIGKLEEAHPEFVITEIVTKPDKKAIIAHYKDTGEIPAGVDIPEKGRYVKVI